MSNGTRSQLRKQGYQEGTDGVWRKADLRTDHPKSSTAIGKQDERSQPVGTEEDKGSRAQSVRYRLFIHSYRTRLIDPSNASFKQIEDCLTPPQGRKKYGIAILPDDSAEYCDQPLFLQTKVKAGQERTEIELYEYSVDGRAF